MNFRCEYKHYSNFPADADKKWFQKRGYAFEKILKALLEEEELRPRGSYKPEGEQIDGSFIFNGQVFLFEAKWRKEEIEASTIYQFKGKVDGKLIGTLGLFISMSGYTKDAVEALILGKSLNVILFDKNDMDLAFEKGIGFSKILEAKIRAAAEEGVVYFPYSKIEIETDANHTPVTKFGVNTAQAINHTLDKVNVLIICEGHRDSQIIIEFIVRLLSQFLVKSRFRILVAMGKRNIAKVANNIQRSNFNKVILIADSDRDSENTLKTFAENIDYHDYIALLPEPTLEEAWLGLDKEQIISVKRKTEADYQRFINAQINSINIDDLLKRDPSFRKFYEIIDSLPRHS